MIISKIAMGIRPLLIYVGILGSIAVKSIKKSLTVTVKGVNIKANIAAAAPMCRPFGEINHTPSILLWSYLKYSSIIFFKMINPIVFFNTDLLLQTSQDRSSN